MGMRDRTDGRDPDLEAEFERFYRTHAQAVAGYVARRVPADSVQDVVADTFAVAWRRLDRLPDEVLPWLLGVARRVIANQYRTSRRQEALRLRLSAEPPRPAESSSGGLPRVVAALLRLPEREREVVLLAAWEGLSAQQAARVLGCSTAAYRLRLHRARRKLAALTDEENDERRPATLRPEELT
jgi:RNA polymerase sigma-70 factor (ECF subfamily)